MTMQQWLWRLRWCGVILLLISTPQTEANDLLIANESQSATKPDSILRFNSTTGALIGSFLSTSIVDPVSMTYGPDGNLYVASSATHSITRYAGQSGLFIDTFVSSQSGGLGTAYDMSFGPDGNLYVAERNKGILRYSGSTGAFLGAWGTSGSGQLTWAQGVTFGPDGKLYVGDDYRVRRYDATGAYLDDFIPTSGGLENVGNLRFGPDGNLYVPGNGGIRRYSGATGAFNGSYSIGQDIVFRPDGKLLTDFACDVVVFDPVTGSSVGTLIPCNTGLNSAQAMVLIVPEPGTMVLLSGLGLLLLRRRR